MGRYPNNPAKQNNQDKIGTDGRRVEVRQYEVQTLQARHQEIIRLKILGEDNTTIAARLGITTVTVSNILNSQIVKNHMAGLQNRRDEEAVDVSERLTTLSSEAVDLYEKILRGTDDASKASLTLRAKVADSILDRAGFGKTTNVNVKSESLVLKSDDIEEIKKRAAERKAQRINGTISDISKPSQIINIGA